MVNPKSLRDIIRDNMDDMVSKPNYGAPRRRKKPSPGGKSVRAGDKSLDKYRMPRKPRETPFDREKYQLPKRGPRKTKAAGGYGRPKPMPKKPRQRAEFPEPMVKGQKRYPAYNVQPQRPKKKER